MIPCRCKAAGNCLPPRLGYGRHHQPGGRRFKEECHLLSRRIHQLFGESSGRMDCCFWPIPAISPSPRQWSLDTTKIQTQTSSRSVEAPKRKAVPTSDNPVGFLCLTIPCGTSAHACAGRAANATPRKGKYAHRLCAASNLPALRRACAGVLRVPPDAEISAVLADSFTHQGTR